MVLCKNCKHFKRDWALAVMTLGIAGYEYAKWGREVITDPVSGATYQPLAYCRIERRWSNETSCGKEGKFFEAA